MSGEIHGEDLSDEDKVRYFLIAHNNYYYRVLFILTIFLLAGGSLLCCFFAEKCKLSLRSIISVFFLNDLYGIHLFFFAIGNSISQPHF